jgi:purine-binding chemotaxis protein CheW
MNPVRVPILTFQMGGQHFALPIGDVLEVAAMVEILTIPHAEAHLLGLANRHGEMMPLLDLCKVMGFESKLHANTFFIVAERDEVRLGLVVDQIDQVKYFPRGDFQKVLGNPFVVFVVNDGTISYQMLELGTIIHTYIQKVDTD